jgi:cyclic pyranopterin phosphate synthase
MTDASTPVRLGRAPRRSASAPPADGPLVDTFGRVHRDLRLSLTDHCNLRCTYCMPEEGTPYAPRPDVLHPAEIVRVARVAHQLGVTSLRLTGGEPLVRRGVIGLVRRLAAIGFSDLSMTTNGMLLAPVADALARAGLRRVNISCDSLRADRFGQIRRRGDLARVLAAMDAAEAAGLHPLKVNVVLMAGENDDEVLDFAEFARRTRRIVRFIEFMPLDGEHAWSRERVVPGDEVIARIGERWPVIALDDGGEGPAERYRFADGQGEIGVISSVSRPFCATCDRVRVTADGAVRNCLFSDDEVSLRAALRGGGSDEDLARLFRRAIWGKLPGHGMDDPNFLRPVRSMSMIGG